MSKNPVILSASRGSTCCSIHVSYSGYSSTLKFTYVPLNHQLTFTRLHSVISQKTELIIVIAVRTLNPTQ
jgi:hypothetical protein